MTEEPELLVDIRDDVLYLTINRPEKRNALSMALLKDLGSALREHRRTSLKCAVLSGAGERCFAAGGDLKELDAVRTNIDARVMSETGHAALDEVRYFPVPVIGAVNGLALGGGAELAMACDIRIAAAHADLGFIQAQLNVTTAWGGGIDLINAVGNSAALAILCSGQRLSAEAALNLHIYTAVCNPDDNFASFVAEFLRGYQSKSINVMRGYKATAARRRKRLHEELTETARDPFVTSWVHEDHWAAAARALKK